jgi:hypothetical protein
LLSATIVHDVVVGYSQVDTYASVDALEVLTPVPTSRYAGIVGNVLGHQFTDDVQIIRVVADLYQPPNDGLLLFCR